MRREVYAPPALAGQTKTLRVQTRHSYRNTPFGMAQLAVLMLLLLLLPSLPCKGGAAPLMSAAQAGGEHQRHQRRQLASSSGGAQLPGDLSQWNRVPGFMQPGQQRIWSREELRPAYRHMGAPQHTRCGARQHTLGVGPAHPGVQVWG